VQDYLFTAMTEAIPFREPTGEDRVFKTIVVGTDFSDTANEAVKEAIDLAKAYGAKVHIVTAFKPAMTASVAASSLEAMAYGGSDVLQEVESKIADEVEANLQRMAKAFTDDGVAVKTHCCAGDPADALIDVAESAKADVIVIGNRGMGGVKRFVLGSVPNKVSHHAPCSVLIVHTT
jgi:nucleotide-binding universal stress UspA family protein